jgi:hypothetical protein
MMFTPHGHFLDRTFSVVLASFLLFSLTVSVAHGADLLAAWEFNVEDIAGMNVSASGGIVAGTTGLLQGDATIIDGSLTLDGDGDYLQFGNDLVDLRSQEAMTIAAWVNTESPVTANRRIVEHEDNIYFWAENELFQYTTHGTPGGADSRAVSTTAPEVGSWQHVLAVYEQGQPAKIFINGVLEGTSSVGQVAMPNNTQTLQIGARRSGSGDPTNFWHGMLDDVAMWNIELSQGNINELSGVGIGGYEARMTPTAITPVPPDEPPPPPSGAKLMARWTMNNADVTGDVIADVAGNAAGPFDGVKMNGGPATGIEGILGEAAEFAGGANNGDHQFIDLGAHTSTLGALTEGTIAAWVKPDMEGLTSDVLTIFSASDIDAPSVEARWFVSNGGSFGTGNLVYGTRGSSADGTAFSTGTNLMDGLWHHVAVTVADDNTVSLYIDGDAVGGGVAGFFADLSAVNGMAIGRNKDNTAGGGQWFYDGLIDDVRIYDKAMTATEIQALVPEPATGILIVMGWMCLLGLTSRRR